MYLVLVFVACAYGQEVIKPEDFLLSKSIYGARTASSYSNSSEIEFYSFSGTLNPDSSQSNMHKIRIKFGSPPFITSDQSKSKNFPSDRSYYGMFSFNQYIYVFGGMGKDEILGDFWFFDTSEDLWAEVKEIEGNNSDAKISARYDFAFTGFSKENFGFFVVIGGIDEKKSELRDCKLVKVSENNKGRWIQGCGDYTECTGMGLSGAQVKYFDGSLYLFSGVNLEGEEYRYFTGVCKLNVESGGKWERMNIESELVGSNRGGSVIYNSYIYYFFGSTYSASGESYNPYVYAFDLTHPASGWVQLLSNSTAGYDSFNYMLYNDSIFILGGKSKQGVSKSLIQLSLTTGDFKVFSYRSPSRRIGAAFLRSSTTLYIFGGESEFFYHNSLWKYLPSLTPYSTKSKWEKALLIQSAPPARKFPASASQGDFLFIAGGISPTNEYYNDFWLLDTRSWKWTQLTPTEDSERPPGFAYACAVLKVPYIYILGGLSNQRIVMKNVWKYDLTKDKIIKMQNFTDEEFPEMLEFGCQYEKWNKWVQGVKKVKESIYVYFGKKNSVESLNCGVGRVDIVNDKYEYINLIRPNQMLCRSSAAYHYEKQKLVVVGGKGYSGKAYKDIWVLNLNETHVISEEKSEFVLQSPVYSSAFTSFNRNLYMFSGLNSNGNSLVRGSSDLIYKLDLTKILKSSTCDIGFEQVNGTCEICPIGSFSSKTGGYCEKCEPVGTLTTIEGSTAGIQCLTEQDYLSASLIPFIEKSLGFNFSEQDQAPIYQAPNMIFFYLFFGVFMVLALSVFLSVFFTFKDFRMFFIKKNLLREKKLRNKKELVDTKNLQEPLLRIRRNGSIVMRELAKKTIQDDMKKKEEKRTKKIKMSVKNEFRLRDYAGGFLTGLFIIFVIGILIYLPVDYFNNNKKEKVELIPTATFINQFHTSNNSLGVNLVTYPFNYGDCSVDLDHSDITSITLKNTTISYLNERNQTIPFACHININLNKSTVYDNDYISINFHNKNIYAKNIFIWIESKSAKPGYISRYMQKVASDKGKSFDGLAPTTFKFLVVPAYFQEEGYFIRNLNNSGLVVHSNQSPLSGSQVFDQHLSVGSSLSLKIWLIGSESSMLTSVYLQVGIVKFLSILSAQIIGIFGAFGGIYLAFQFVRKKMNQRKKRLQREKQEKMVSENLVLEEYDDEDSAGEKYENKEEEEKKKV